MKRFLPRLLAGLLLVAPLALVASARPTGPGMLPLSQRTTPTATATAQTTSTTSPSSSPTPTRTPLPVPASEADNGRTIFVTRNGLIELRLSSDPSAGQTWTVVSSRNVRLEGEPTFEPAPTPAPTTSLSTPVAAPTTSATITASAPPTASTTAGSDTFPVPGATPSIVSTAGSTGFSVFRFRALREGRGDLALDLRASDSKPGEKAAKQFRAQIRVLK